MWRALSLLLIASCAHQPPRAAVQITGSASICTVLVPADKEATTGGSKLLRDAISERLARHGLSASFGCEAQTGRSTEARVQIAARQSKADHVVLVEAKPIFVSQVAGRYRWKVDVALTMAPRSELGKARTWSWKIPVFLLFYHQREPAALDAAVPVLKRNLDRALSEYLER